MVLRPIAAERLDRASTLTPTRVDNAVLGRGAPHRATPVEVTPEGYRIYEGTLAYGDVALHYPDLNPPRWEFMPWSEISAPESVRSAIGKPVAGASFFTPTGHPPSNRTADDVKPHLEGTVLDAWADEATKSVRFRAVIHTTALGEAIDGGVVEVSGGYSNDTDATPGVAPGGQRYDVVKRNVRWNHVAPVPEARNRKADGTAARLDEMPVCDAHPVANANGADAMDPETIIETMNPLSAAGVALLDQMPTADRSIIDEALACMAAMKAAPPAAATATADPALAASGEGEESPATDVVIEDAAPLAVDGVIPGATDASGTPEMDAHDEAAMTAAGSTTTMDETKIKQMVNDAVAQALAAQKPAGARDNSRLDGSPAVVNVSVGDLAGLDIESVMKKVEDRAFKTASQRLDALGALVSRARADGHDVHTPTDAAAAMIKDVDAHCAPALAARFKAEIKAGRLDAATYEQAQVLKKANDERLAVEMEAVVGFAPQGRPGQRDRFDMSAVPASPLARPAERFPHPNATRRPARGNA